MRWSIPLMLSLSCAVQAIPSPEDIASRILCLCNQVRRDAGLRPICLDARLSQAALQHSQEMDRLHYFGHVSPLSESATLIQRMNSAGVYALSSAENLHREAGYGSNSTADNAVRSWMASPIHRRNLLNPHFNKMGLGVAQNGEQFTITQDFAYEAVDVLEKRINSSATGLHVSLFCRVNDGTQSGAVFYQGRRWANWACDFQGQFQVELDLPGPGILAIGQTEGERSWVVETELRVQ